MTDLAKFGKVIKLESFLPFKSGANALENINCVSEGKHTHTNTHIHTVHTPNTPHSTHTHREHTHIQTQCRYTPHSTHTTNTHNTVHTHQNTHTKTHTPKHINCV